VLGVISVMSLCCQCPTRKSSHKGALDEDEHEYIEVYDSEDGASDVKEAIRACSVQLNVIMCLIASPRVDNWRRTSMFHTYVKLNDKLYSHD